MAPIDLSKPLLNRTILAVCSAAKMPQLAAGLESMGGKVLRLPVIEPREIENKEMLDRAADNLDAYDWILFTSIHGVVFFARRLQELGIAASSHRMPQICAIGPSTAKAVEEAGYKVTLVPENFVAEGIVDALVKHHGDPGTLAGKRILLPRARKGREILPEALNALGAQVDVVPCYETVQADLDETTMRELRKAVPELVVFTSSSTVTGLVDLLGKQILLEPVIAVLGPITGRTVEGFGKNAAIIPKENTIPSLLEEIHSYYISNLDSPCRQ